MKILMALLLGVVMACGNCGCKKNYAAQQAPSDEAPTGHFIPMELVKPETQNQEDKKDEGKEDDDSPYKEGDEIILQFSAVWCMPCKILKQTITNSNKIQTHFKDHTKGFWVLDIEDDDEITQAWVAIVKPGSIPTVTRFVRKDGDWVEHSRFVGVRSEDQIMAFLTSK